MADAQKDTIYIDVDDEITSIIDKLRSSDKKIVALVLPKRAAVFQSIVNMKLLKRTADEQKKNLVLITSEASLLPLAGATGIHVAKSLQSRPEVPTAPQLSDKPVSVEDAEDQDGIDETQETAPDTGQEEPIEVDNDEPDAALAAAAVAPKKPFNKKLKVPNFDSFRTRLFLGVAAVLLLVVGWFVTMRVLPKATVTIKTNTLNVATNITVTGTVGAKQADPIQMIVPAEQKEFKKTDTQKVPATGKKDMGTQASGTVTFTLTDCPDTLSIPQGTAVAAGNFNFITQDTVTLIGQRKAGKCNNDSDAVGSVKVIAQQAGDSYNLSPRAYSVAGVSGVSASGSAMSGGTSKIVTVVSQDDVNAAKQKITDANSSSSSSEVAKQLKADGFLPLSETVATSDPLVTASPNVGDEAAEVTVTVAATYTMSGVKEDDLKKLLDNDIKKHINTNEQTILNNGLGKPTITILDKAKDGGVKFTLQTTATAGVQQDEAAIKQAIAGKKKGEVQSILLARPGVKDVSVEYSPFWVYKTPSSVNKLNIVFQNSDAK